MTRFHPFPFITCFIPEDSTFNPDLSKHLSQHFGEIHLSVEPSKHDDQILAAVFVPLQHLCFAVQLLIEGYDCALLTNLLCHGLTVLQDSP